MPRRARVILPGAPLHLIQRGNNRCACFFDDQDYQFYLERVWGQVLNCESADTDRLEQHFFWVAMKYVDQKPDLLSCLVANSIIAPRDIDAFNRVHNESSKSKPVLLSRLGLVSQEHLVEHYAKFLNIPTASSDDLAARACRDTGCSPAFMKHQRICGFEDRAGKKLLAMQDPEDGYALDAMEYATGEHYGRAVATGDDILAAIDRVALPDADQPREQ